MERIGLRELRQHASRWVARAAAGETIEITDRGRPVATLSPHHALSARDRLIAAGQLIPGHGSPLDVEPVSDRLPSVSAALEAMRDEER